jgi:iron(III) transport system substrate-binding protein
MKFSKTILATAFTVAFAAAAIPASAQAPAGYPADYGSIVDAAKKEGKLVVYSTTDTKAAESLIKDFNAM